MEASRDLGARGSVPSGMGLRLGAMSLAVALALGLSACGGGGSGNVKVTQASTPPTVPPSTGGNAGSGDGTGGQAGGTGGEGSGGSTAASGEISVDAGSVATRADNITGAVAMLKTGTGALTLTGTNAYSGSTLVQAGSLFVDGDQSAATGLTTVDTGATLGGKGTVGGDVKVSDGATLAPGSLGAIGTLTVNGNLGLSSGSTLAYDFPTLTADDMQRSDFLDVKGNLVLDGTLSVRTGSATLGGPGIYRLIDYSGSLTNNGLDAPTGLLIQTGVAHQVNLINAQGMNLNFWDGDAGPQNDGVINGGSGTWQGNGALAKTNWTDASGTSDNRFDAGAFAVFQGAAGTVNVDASQGDVTVSGLQFATNGYLVQGDPIHVAGSAGDAGQTVIRVGDGTQAGAAYTATIASVLTGSSGLTKADLGTLILGGDNTYTGGTTVSSGVLQLGNGGSSGSVIGNVVDNAVLAFNRTDLSSFNGIISGTGSLKQAGTGTLILTGNNTYSGGTTVSDGVLQIGNGGTAGSISGNIVNNKYIRFDRADDVVFSGNITGTGALLKDGAGALIVTGAITEDGTNTLNKPTTITSGTLQVGNGGTVGSVSGDIANNAALVFNRSDTVTFDGKVNGTGSLTQAGTGTLILTNDATFSGVTINRGTLQVGNGGANNWNAGSITNNGTLIFNFGYPPGVAGGTGALISGSGNLIKDGAATYSLSANNTYTGGTLVRAGTLQLGTGGTTGWVEGDITNNSVLVFNRSDNVSFDRQVTGAGLVQKAGYNTLTITGDLDQTGGTQISGGTLQIGDGGVTGSLAGDVIDDATLAFNRSTDLTYSGLISGSGKLMKLGTGVLSLGGVNTYTGGTYVSDGTLRILSGSSLAFTTYVGGNQAHAALEIDHGASAGSVQLEDAASLDNAGTLMVDSSYVTTVSGDASSVVNRDGGIIDNVPHSGLAAPAVRLGQNSLLTNSTGSLIRGFIGVDSDGTVNNQGGTITGLMDDGISGNATSVNNTDGGLIVSGSQPPNNLSISSGVSTMANNAMISNNGSSSIRGVLYGTRMLDGGTVTNEGGSNITGINAVSIASQSGATATVINIGGSRISGSQIGLYLNYGGTVTNGAGSMIEATATSSGDCSATPACAIYVPVYSAVGSYGNNGKLSLTNAGYIVGDVQMDPSRVNNVTLSAGGYINGALKIGSNGQSTLTLDGDTGTSQLYSSAVTGATVFNGNLVKNGSGSWTLDNDQLLGVVNTSINAGSLRAAHSLAGDVTVNAGGVLDGVPGVNGNLSSAGRVAVRGGNSTVGGNYSQAAGATLAVSLGSKLSVSGTASLGGILQVTGADGGYVSNTHTDVLTASGGVTGAFNSLVKDTGVIFTSSTINYTANSVWLDTTGLNITAAMADRGVTLTPASFASAQRVQGAFTQLDSKIASDDVADVPTSFVKAAGQIQQVATVQAAQSSLQSLSGQLHAASAAMTFEAIDASSRAMADRFDDLLGKKTAYGMWTHNLSTSGSMARAGFDGVGFQLNGWMVGNDQQVGSSGVAGFAFGQSQAQQQLNQSADRNHSRNTEAMVYAGALNGTWYTQGRIGFGHFQQDVNRQLLLGTSAQGVSTQYGGDYNVGYGETGLNLNWAGTRILPFVNLEYANVRRDGFAEQGAGGFGLRANAQTLDRWQAGIGLRATRHWDFGGGRALDFRMSAQFQQTLASRGDAFDASFVELKQWQPLVGVGLSRYSTVFNVGMKAALSERTSLDFGYDYERGQRDQAQTVSARLVKAL